MEDLLTSSLLKQNVLNLRHWSDIEDNIPSVTTHKTCKSKKQIKGNKKKEENYAESGDGWVVLTAFCFSFNFINIIIKILNKHT